MLTRNRRPHQSPLETLSDLKSHIRRLKDAKQKENADTSRNLSGNAAETPKIEPHCQVDRLPG